MTLWNPAIRKYKLIPKSLLLQNKLCFVRARFGFAYDVVDLDYKVLCVHYDVIKNTTHPRYIVEIYSVKNQSWRTIHNIFPIPTDFQLYLCPDPVSVNGCIQMMARDRTKIEHLVISFNLADENFIVTPVQRKYGKLLKLLAYGDRVCVLATVGKEMSIWSLEKDGKTALFTWNYITKFPILISVIGKPSWYDGICVEENGNILWREYNGPFIEYDVRKNEYTEFNLTELPPFSAKRASYVESLASLKIPWD